MSGKGKEGRVPQIRFAGFTDPWEQRKFGDMYAVNNERNTNCELGYDRTLSIATMTFNGGNGAADDSLSNYKVIRVGDIAFEGHTNKVHAYGRFVLNDAGDGLMSPRFSCLRPIVEQRYAFWKYYIPREETMRPILVKATKSGTMMNELVPDDLMRESILVPCLAEQEVIGSCFTQLDHLITLHQRKYDKLCAVKKSMLDKMFPKGGSLYPEIRFAGFTDPWEQRKLGDVGYATSGIGFPDAEQGGKEGIPFFKVSDMNLPENSRELVTSNNYVTESQIAANGWHPIANLPAIFFAKVGAAVYLNRKRLVDTPFLLDNNTMAFSLDTEKISSSFAQSLFEGIDLTALTQVGALPSLNAADIESLETLMPLDMGEQVKIGRYFANLDSLITLHQRKLELLRNIKKAMLDKMFA